MPKRTLLEQGKPHDFRCFLGTGLARHDVHKAQEVLGHQRIETLVQQDAHDPFDPDWTTHLS